MGAVFTFKIQHVGENTKMMTAKCSLRAKERSIISGGLDGVECQKNGGRVSFLMLCDDVLILKLSEERSGNYVHLPCGTSRSITVTPRPV